MSQLRFRHVETGIDMIMIPCVRDIHQVEELVQSFFEKTFGHVVNQGELDEIDELGGTRIIVEGVRNLTTTSTTATYDIFVEPEAAYPTEEIVPDPRNPVYLYILVRTDMESLTGTPENRKAGLPAAQAGHSANQMVFEARQKNDPELNKMLTEWENETGKGFGTEIVLGAHISKVKQTIEHAALLGHHAAMTFDPEYPLRDGQMLHLIPLESCGYIFGRKNVLSRLLSTFDLLP